MYLVAWEQQEGRLEASLGGRVTVDEMEAFVEDMQALLADIGRQPYLLILDYGEAKPFDNDASAVLMTFKDFCLATGASMVVSVVQDEKTVVSHTSERLQLVLEGKEAFVCDANQVTWPEAIRTIVTERRAAA